MADELEQALSEAAEAAVVDPPTTEETPIDETDEITDAGDTGEAQSNESGEESANLSNEDWRTKRLNPVLEERRRLKEENEGYKTILSDPVRLAAFAAQQGVVLPQPQQPQNTPPTFTGREDEPVPPEILQRYLPAEVANVDESELNDVALNLLNGVKAVAANQARLDRRNALESEATRQAQVRASIAAYNAERDRLAKSAGLTLTKDDQAMVDNVAAMLVRGTNGAAPPEVIAQLSFNATQSKLLEARAKAANAKAARDATVTQAKRDVAQARPSGGNKPAGGQERVFATPEEAASAAWEAAYGEA